MDYPERSIAKFDAVPKDKACFKDQVELNDQWQT